jgi:hypothetical protein
MFGSVMAYVTGLKLYPMAELDVQCHRFGFLSENQSVREVTANSNKNI